MIYFFLLAIFAMGNELFSLVPDTIPTLDIGLLLIFGGLAAILLNRNANFRNCLNVFGFFSLAYMLLVAAHASIAAFYYQQPIIDGLIAARKQYYYLSFFLFAVLLSDRDRIRSTLDLLSLLALVLFFLGLVNYFVHPIFHHKWAEGQGMRGGITRGYIPGMQIIVMACIWQAYKLVKRSRISYTQLLYLMTLLGAVLFRQTRAHLLVVLGVIGLMLLINKRWSILLLGSLVLFLGTIALSFYTQENLIVSAVTSTYLDLSEGSGTWGARLNQIQNSSEQLAETFWTGSGGVTIRATGGWEAIGSTLGLITRNMDLGYFVWLKFYGLPGLILLLVLFAGYASHVLNIRRVTVPEDRELLGFAGYYFLAILVSMITLPYLTSADGIILSCLAMSIFASCSHRATLR
ncbi:MAG: hypothetical protein IPO61_05540 [Gammaproteobacteria bacterium]|nr:hypothetical protein [Gammaproteobacteria bacterium]